MKREHYQHTLAILLVSCCVFAGTLRAQLPQLPKVPTDISERIPNLQDIMKGEDPVSTNLSDAVTEVTFLDDFDLDGGTPLGVLNRNDQGDWIIENPGNYIYNVQSYCLKAGTYAPGGGSGYLYAPLKGTRSTIVGNILRNSVEHPEIPQSDIQVLLWAIIARTKLSDMSREKQLTAAKLLTPKEIFDLNGGALGLVPENRFDDVFANTPEPVRRVLETEAKLRNMLTSGEASYEELEAVAVLHGAPAPEKGDREVPLGRWSYHPNGFFVRYFPRGYTILHIEIYAPEAFHIERDNLGRITMIEDSLGRRIITEYDDSIEPASVTGDPSIKGYAFRLIRFERENPDNYNDTIRVEWKNTGYTLVGTPNNKGTITNRPTRFDNLGARYAWANRHKNQIAALDKQFNPTGQLDAVMNLGHYTAALEEATGGSHMKKKGWYDYDQINLVRKAWQYEVNVREGGHQWGTAPSRSIFDNLIEGIGQVISPMLFGDSDNGSGTGMGGGAAQPGQHGRQRLAPSGRGTDDANKCANDYAKCKEQAKNDYWRCASQYIDDDLDPTGPPDSEWREGIRECANQLRRDIQDCRTIAQYCLEH
jgi:hypothetical protein